VPLTALAGPFVEVIAGADSGRRWQLAHGDDLRCALVGIDECRAAGLELSMETVASLACSVVISNWSPILRVGACLLAVNELTGAEIAALCAGARRDTGDAGLSGRFRLRFRESSPDRMLIWQGLHVPPDEANARR
jgi:hypothetical protein